MSGGIDDEMKIYTTENIAENEIKKIKELLSQYTHLNSSSFKIVKIKKIPRNEFGKILFSKIDTFEINDIMK